MCIGSGGATHECHAVHQSLADLLARACEIQQEALAGSTKSQYSLHVRWFAEFCVVAKCVHCFGQPSEHLVMAYATYLFQTVKAATVTQYLKGLKEFFRKRGYVQFADPVAWPELHRVLKGMQRVGKAQVSKKQPIFP